MQPAIWKPPVVLTQQEEHIVNKIRKAKLFVFLRRYRHELFDEAFQEELAGLYRKVERGQPPVAPAMLALALIMEAYTGVSDDEVIEATLMDRRWQLVLDCLDTDQAPFSKGTLVAFRQRLIAGQMDRRLIERTIEIASQSQAFGPRALRAALDSSPLWGAGRVEDTYNLVGHALKKVMRVVADQQGRELVEVAKEAGAELVCGSSLKAELDRDWDQHIEKDEALTLVLNVLRAVETWVQTLQQEDALLAQPSLSIAQQVKAQDVQVDEKGKESLIKGVAKDRRISVEDSEMRHGRKSRSVLVNGYKRHVLHDLDTGLIRAVGITPANVAEASVTEAISEDLERQEVCLKELHIDRAYLSSHLVRERSDDLEVYCKAWPVRESKRFSKQTFTLDWERQIIRCPAEQEMPFVPGGVVHFPKETCAQCPLKEQCTTSAKGRSVSIHPDEALLMELRQRQQTPQKRRRLSRAAVESNDDPDLRDATEAAMHRHGVRVVFVDEAHHLLYGRDGTGGSTLQEQLEWLKSLGNKAGALFILMGTYDLFNFGKLSGQTARRCLPVHFPRYQLGREEDCLEFQAALLELLRRVPLECSAERWVTDHWLYFYECSVGCIGILKEWLLRAVCTALDDGLTRLSLDCVQDHALHVDVYRQMALDAYEGEQRLNHTEVNREHVWRLLQGGELIAPVPPLPPREAPPSRVEETKPAPTAETLPADASPTSPTEVPSPIKKSRGRKRSEAPASEKETGSVSQAEEGKTSAKRGRKKKTAEETSTLAPMEAAPTDSTNALQASIDAEALVAPAKPKRTRRVGEPKPKRYPVGEQETA